ncbi:SCO family protein [Parageobacillus thermoglucosidasius]|uniref:Electron transporter SenC n=1 Tax=Parageobacillus thermoglucosidasius TaxID=1426 RepID=A0AAN0YUG4_PARTM|nr:SCO family protein [Parageobacillus thermoglucosidasius]REK57878.1 MAG: SCO family protein [Geobacillus sp.]ALF12017.1 electron transporter SenC [Parageobacillus thermoglucosidasius]ANZ32103.1 electron transporter SenC [Parageobacillus thermoglucosidasius]APM82834.1 electron transporter SenC [Parageobacillus thermoglucosidasius]KJX70535.1 electron transporter SenC [Parageobacillus thermoglucosidasius]
MKKLYLSLTILFILCVGAGVFYFTVYRQAKMELPKDVVMETAWGEEYRFSDEKPKIRLLEFMYTNCPDVCPNTTFQMTKLREKLEREHVFGKNVEFITITIDPKRDTREKLQTYAKTFGVTNSKQGWLFLRGSEADTKKVADAFDFQYRDPGNGMLIHTTLTYLLDENGRVIEQFGMGKQRFHVQEVYAAIMDELK